MQLHPRFVYCTFHCRYMYIIGVSLIINLLPVGLHCDKLASWLFYVSFYIIHYNFCCRYGYPVCTTISISYAPSCAFFCKNITINRLSDDRTTPLITEDRCQFTRIYRLPIHFSPSFSHPAFSVVPIRHVSIRIWSF